MSDKKLDVLVQQLQDAKEIEEQAKNRRTVLEKEIADLAVTEQTEGTHTKITKNYKISVTVKMNRKLDCEAYKKFENGIPEDLKPVDYKPVINLKRLRFLEAVEKNLPSQFITTSFGKPAIKIEEIKNGDSKN